MALAQIKAALTFENEDKAKQASLKTFGWWDLPDNVAVWRQEVRRGDGEVLCLPRGFGGQLAAGLAGAGLQVAWDDQRSRYPAARGYFQPFMLRDYQAKAVMEMMAAEQGVLRAPPGAGKTVAMLGLMAWLQQRSVVIVDKAGLLEQWRARAAQFLGLSLDLDDERSVGKIGEDVWVERDLTICLRQTLFSRLWEIKATDWFSRIGVTVLDEVQHLSSNSLQEILREVSSSYVFGVSATPARTVMQGQVTAALIGPIVADVPREILRKRGILMLPSVEVIDTKLQANFWDDHDSDVDGSCKVPDCDKHKRHRHKNNYQSVLKALVEDKDRNKLIGDRIAKDRGHVHLVYSRQLKHLDKIRVAAQKAGWDGPVYYLRGEENAKGDSQAISDAIVAGGFWELDEEHLKETKERVWRQVDGVENRAREALLLSTVADEGLDIPPIDRVHLVFPVRQAAATIQIIGRGERTAEGKTDCRIIDYHDPGCTVFHDQHRERVRTYRMQELSMA